MRLPPNLIVLDGRRYVLVALKDISERKRAEEALREKEHLLSESQKRVRQYAGSGATGYFEIELRRRDGRLVDVESYGAPCRINGRRDGPAPSGTPAPGIRAEAS
jgi:hypothetical protein